jgi:hypothetical protein
VATSNFWWWLKAGVRLHVRVIVFVGPLQTKIAFEKAAALQRMGANAEYVRLSGGGANALDFHIAYYLGQLTAKDPTAYFHFISKDTGSGKENYGRAGCGQSGRSRSSSP